MNTVVNTIKDTIGTLTLDNPCAWKSLRNVEVPALFAGSTAADMNKTLIADALSTIAIEVIVKVTKPNEKYTLEDVALALNSMLEESSQIVPENPEESVAMFSWGDGFVLDGIARVSVLRALIAVANEQRGH